MSSLSPAPIVYGRYGVSCVSAPKSCTAVGAYVDTINNANALIETESDGTWSAVQEPSLASLSSPPSSSPSASLDGISCTSSNTCTAVGNYKDTNDNTDALIETESDGTWSVEQEPSTASLSPAPSSSLGAEGLNVVSCTSATTCTAVGNYEFALDGHDPLIETESYGTWSAVELAGLPTGCLVHLGRRLHGGRRLLQRE